MSASSNEQRPAAATAGRPNPQSAGAGRALWLNGDVVVCACPVCAAPMSVRLWLMTADCWQCSASIDLTLEEQREVQRLLEERRRAGQTATARPTPPAAATVQQPAQESVETRPRQATPTSVPKTTSAAPPAAPARTKRAAMLAARLALRRSLVSWKNMPPWLISAAFHGLLILLLGLWTVAAYEDYPRIVLSASVGPEHRLGGDVAEDALQQASFELPVDKKPHQPPQREALAEAERNARELQIDPPQPTGRLPQLAQVKSDLASSNPYRRMLATRDPRLRAEVVRRSGGTTQTEAAVARALRWIVLHQHADGRWSLDRFSEAHECRGRCGGQAGLQSDVGGTALALLAMLGTGQTHQSGKYRKPISRGLAWMLAEQKSDGDLRHRSSRQTGMYTQALAAIVLCDALKLSGDRELREPAQAAIDFICRAQHRRGGWRYRPGEAGDMSVVGWQLMALHSARSAELHVPEEVMQRSAEFLDDVKKDTLGATYAYRRHRPPTPTMTAEGLLSRMYLGWDRKEPGLALGVDLLVEEHLPSTEWPNIYYWYYGTQVMHHWGGQPWDDWNQAMREVLVSTQEKSGHKAGSWSPRRMPHGSGGGRLYVTALAACTLEVYYRYAPLYWPLDLD